MQASSVAHKKNGGHLSVFLRDTFYPVVIFLRISSKLPLWDEFCLPCLLLETAVMLVLIPQNSESNYWDLVPIMEKKRFPISLHLLSSFLVCLFRLFILPWLLCLKFTLEKTNEAFPAWLPQETGN